MKINNNNEEKNLLDKLEDKMRVALGEIPRQSSALELQYADPRMLVEIAASYVVVASQQNVSFVSLLANVGHRVRARLGFSRDSKRAALAGAKILEVFEEAGLFKRELLSNGKHEAYHCVAHDEARLSELWDLCPREQNDHSPKTEQLSDWTSGVHQNGLPIVKHSSGEFLRKFDPVKQPVVFNTLNKLQRQGWEVNTDVLKILIKLFRNKELAEFSGSFAFGHDNPLTSRVARKSKRLEVDLIRKTARSLKGETFYHQYNADFRGRIYPCSGYLHEQSSDPAKALLLFAEGRELGDRGLEWLALHASNCWGEDKISLADRIRFADENLEEWIQFAEDPLGNRGWIEADSCWSFLAACNEFLKIWKFVEAGGDVYEYVCHLPAFVDGSNNGVQWLASLSKDSVVAPLVNLTPNDLPGDVYATVANAAWKRISDDYDPSLDSEMNAYLEKMRDFEVQKSVKQSKKSWKAVCSQANEFRAENKDLLSKCQSNFWMAVKNPKVRRSVCKRPVMTLGYGSSAFGFKDQILDDGPEIDDAFQNLEFAFARYLADILYTTCVGADGVDAELPGPAKMLDLFKTLATRRVEKGERLGWIVPVTNFPVVQQYTSPVSKRIQFGYLGETLKLTIQIREETLLDKRKQKSSAAPNVVHSFDAGHLAMTVNECDYPIATVHDSWGCTPGDMSDLFETVREQFVEFNERDPLALLLSGENASDLMPTRGSLDVSTVLESDFAFA